MKVLRPIVFRIDDAQRAKLEDLAQRASKTPRGMWNRIRRVTTSELVREALTLAIVELEKRYPPEGRSRRITPKLEGRITPKLEGRITPSSSSSKRNTRRRRPRSAP